MDFLGVGVEDPDSESDSGSFFLTGSGDSSRLRLAGVGDGDRCLFDDFLRLGDGERLSDPLSLSLEYSLPGSLGADGGGDALRAPEDFGLG